METYDAVKDFIKYITAEDNEMPYGGLVNGAPKSAKEAYAKYVKAQNKLKSQNIKE